MDPGKDLPYRAEYAKSGRAGCKSCKEPIAKDSLRLAAMVQSPFFDGKQPNWFHYSCFFARHRPKDVSDIGHFESLRWNDQENIRKKIEGLTGCPVDDTKSSKSKKRSKSVASSIPDLQDYTVGYAKSGKSKCKVCEENIKKDEVRISKKDYESEIALQYGATERWHHLDCFVKAREELGFYGPANILPGYKTLSPEDQKILKSKIPEIKRSDSTDGCSPAKKPKQDEIPKEYLKKQNEIMFKYRDQLEQLTKSELTSLLEFNNQEIPEGVSKILDRLSDAITFGALKKCKKCKGQLSFRSGAGYQCLGYVNEWAKCQTIYKTPPRVPFKVPKELKEDYTFLKNYKGKVGERLFNQTISPDKPPTEGKTKTSDSPFSSLKFLIHKTEKKTSEGLKKEVESLGGSVVKVIDEGLTAVVSTNAELSKSKMSKTLKSAKELEVSVISDDFFDGVTPSTSKSEVIKLIKEKKISSWDCNLDDKKIKEERSDVQKSVYPKKSVYPNKSEIFKLNETVKKVTIKDGLAVDPDSQLDKVAHVYRIGDEIYSVVLSLADIQTGKNSYYKLQILESDKNKKYWVFRAWGRIGTTIGGNKCDQYESLDECIDIFKEHFLDKTGNHWESRRRFKKVPGKMMMLDVQYKDEKKKVEEGKSKTKVESKILSKSVQDLITLIFDIEAMKRTMLEFELDLNKMPLGKISQKQIQNAFEILTELQNLINEAAETSRLIEKTNMFYTLVPHDFGVNVPPLLDNVDVIKQKIDMLNNLMEIEIAYKMLEECEKSENSIDGHYKKLNTEITDLDPKSEEYKIIETYVKNTHAKTHMNYSLKIENVFKIERKGEARKYKKFSDLPNKKLLWHGSRITNFAGILSQGLRIAPPEAPVTGYMFGKGIYFADMVSKSANYCNTTKKNPTGLLLLCEVALGEMHELTKAEYIEKLPPGKHSVKGVGKTKPDPSEVATTPSGAEVPLGKGVDAKIKDSSLLYNEYIVYNVAQVKIQYLLRLKFEHKI